MPSTHQYEFDILKEIVSFSSDAILIVDKQYNILTLNKRFESLFPEHKNKLTGENLTTYEKKWFNQEITPSLLEHRAPSIFTFNHSNNTSMGGTVIPMTMEESRIELFIFLVKETAKLPKERVNNNPYQDLVSANKQMNELVKMLEKVALFDTTILLYGESGTGKGLLARYIHQKSLRKNEPFIVINCAALPEQLLESELFGYTEGSFTGANKNGKIGLIEAANNGTLFLDEIGELPHNIQAKLLHVIQDRELTPIGDTKSKKVNIRIITATNKNLRQMVEKSEFREDLYYRLNVIDVKVPSLRDRKKDIIPLADYFLHKFNSKYNLNRRIDKEVYSFFEGYQWPGNVRELENLIEKLIVMSEDLITMDYIPAHLQELEIIVPAEAPVTSFDESLEKFEKKIISETYHRFKNHRKVAEFLKISQSRAARLIRKYNLRVE